MRTRSLVPVLELEPAGGGDAADGDGEKLWGPRKVLEKRGSGGHGVTALPLRRESVHGV